MVSNTFIGHFMADANGEYVKVYLYLLYLASGNGGEGSFSVNGACDFLNCTENDVKRALIYWEKTGLISLTYDEKGSIIAVSLSDSTSVVENGANLVTSYTVPAESEKPIENNAPADTPVDSDADLKWLFSVSEKFIGRMLTSSDLNLITDLYDKMGCSKDLIIYLYESCAETDHTNPKYIEAVARNWMNAGVRTVEEAKHASAAYNSNYKAVMKAFGMNRLPGEAELVYIDRWVGEYGMNAEMIKTACGRALISTGKPDFKYTEGIIRKWNEKNIHTTEQLAEEDRFHAVKSQAVRANEAPKPVNNRFTSFAQRTYTKEQMDAIKEKMTVKY